MREITLAPFTEEQYHVFFRGYRQDPLMTPDPFVYSEEQVSMSYRWNYGGFQQHYAHYGIFLDGVPVGSFQLKRIDPETKTCEFGIILQHDGYKDRGIGTEAIRRGMRLAADEFGVETVIGDTAGRNKRMQRVFEKLGFEMTETIPDAFELPDGTKDSCLIWRKTLKETEETK
ncbi:MAG: GNAT family N-acetyltransferase [Clostridiales bacterium]|nr:GNAT family N-acetyltransferase [Clostridiales bacterium]